MAKATNLETAITQSPDNAAINFGQLGWVIVVEKDGEFDVTSEQHPYKPNHFENLGGTQKQLAASQQRDVGAA